MTRYFRNRACGCSRCKARNLIGPGILITLGILLFIREYWHAHDGVLFPVLLIAIGLFLAVANSASAEGHVQPWWAVGGAATPRSSKNEPQQSGSDPRQAAANLQVKL
jgi:hypothetical protein